MKSKANNIKEINSTIINPSDIQLFDIDFLSSNEERLQSNISSQKREQIIQDSKRMIEDTISNSKKDIKPIDGYKKNEHGIFVRENNLWQTETSIKVDLIYNPIQIINQ